MLGSVGWELLEVTQQGPLSLLPPREQAVPVYLAHEIWDACLARQQVLQGKETQPLPAGLAISQAREHVTAGKAGTPFGSFHQEMVCDPPCDPTLAVSCLVCK